MRITRSHLDYWRSKQPLPSWATSRQGQAVTVDALINLQESGYLTAHGVLAAGNLLSLCRLIRKRGSLLPELDRMALEPGTLINPEKRAAYAKKWAARIRATHGA